MYSDYLYKLYQEKKCGGGDFVRLFDYFTLVESAVDVESAVGITQCKYAHIQKYMRYGTKGNIRFDDMISYYLIYLKIYELGYQSDSPLSRQDNIMAIYRTMMNMYDPYREYEIKNIKRYTYKKYGIALN